MQDLRPSGCCPESSIISAVSRFYKWLLLHMPAPGMRDILMSFSTNGHTSRMLKHCAEVLMLVSRGEMDGEKLREAPK